MDMFLEHQIATVAAVHRDVDDVAYVAVTLDDDPGRDLHDWYGRFYYFYPEEIEPIAADAGTSSLMERRSRQMGRIVTSPPPSHSASSS